MLLIMPTTAPNQKSPLRGIFGLAEREGFEPPVRETRTTDFESAPFDHSGTSPNSWFHQQPPRCLRIAGQLIGFDRAKRAFSPLRGALRASTFLRKGVESAPFDHLRHLSKFFTCGARPAHLKSVWALHNGRESYH